MIQLRPYQQAGVQGIRQSFAAKNRAVLYVLPTGGGKTFTFSYISNGVQRRGRRVLILVHRKELLIQASMSLAKLGIMHALIAQGPHIREIQRQHMVELRTCAVDQSARVAVASVDTLINRMSRIPPPDMIICDEAHHCVAGNKWGRIVEYYDNSRLLGVTATPVRTDGKGLGKHAGGMFDDMVLGPTINELIEQGHLLRPTVYAPPTPFDPKGLRRSRGEYVKSELQKRFDEHKKQIVGDAVDHYQQHAGGLPFIAFCISVKDAEDVAAAFRARGLRVQSIDGSMHDAERRGLINGLATGKLDGLTSCDLISEGTDIPVVGCGIMLRPTESESLFIQQAGRILRPYPGQTEAILLDHVGNVGQFKDGIFEVKHGLPDADREWTLDGRTPGAKREASETSVRVMQCQTCYATFLPAPRCPHCGTPVEFRTREIEQVEGSLQRISPEEARRQKIARRIEQGTAETFEDLVKIGQSRGYKNPAAWARHIYNNRRSRQAKQSLQGESQWEKQNSFAEF